MNPVLSEFCMKLSMEARGVSAVNAMRFHDCAIRSGAMSLLVSASSSALINFWASSGFFAIQSVSAACASANFFARSRCSRRNFALETSTVVATSFSSTRIFPPDSRSSRETHGSTVQTASTFFCWKSWS